MLESFLMKHLLKKFYNTIFVKTKNSQRQIPFFAAACLLRKCLKLRKPLQRNYLAPKNLRRKVLILHLTTFIARMSFKQATHLGVMNILSLTGGGDLAVRGFLCVHVFILLLMSKSPTLSIWKN